MTNLESLSESLRKKGYYVQLAHGNDPPWTCTLNTIHLKVPPRGSGLTALDAVIAADTDRIILLSQSLYRT